MQALGQPGCTDIRFGERRDKLLRIGMSQPCERHAARAGFAAQALDQSRQLLVAVRFFAAIGIDHEHGALATCRAR